MIDSQTLWNDIERIRAEAPLVHNITNYVVMNTTANALLALGASPVMAHAIDEVEEMTSFAGALVLNIGTLSRPWVESMQKAIRAARNLGKPVVLDPVGAGATRLRTQTVRYLMEEAMPTILRGNASEVLSLCSEDGRTKGVDATIGSDAVMEQGRQLIGRGCEVVVISGEVDWILSDGACWSVANGHPMMPRVTGLGCTATALCGAFAAVNDRPAAAAAHAMAVMGIAGEIAAEGAPGPGSLQLRFLDALYALSREDIEARLKVAGHAA
jgi:hydroxyethylthiazole kinase